MADVLFLDAEQAVIEGITDDLAPVHVGTVVPKPRPRKFLVVHRLGGVDTTVVTEDATLTVEAWCDDDREAHDLAQFARYLIHHLPGRTVAGVLVYLVQEFAGPARLPDPESDQPRWTFTVSVRVRGIAI